MAVSPLECEPQPDSHERRELDPDTCYRSKSSLTRDFFSALLKVLYANVRLSGPAYKCAETLH